MIKISCHSDKKILRSCLSILVFIVLSFLFTLPLLKNLYLSCRGDWDYFSFLYEIPSISLFEYRQFPFWNPYCGGGLPFIGNPQQGFMSPVFILTAIFGTFAGLKISIWLHTFIGLSGTWFVAEQLGVKGVARFAPPLIFMFAGPWVFHLTEGQIVWLPAAFIPWLLLGLIKGTASRLWLIVSALCASIMFYEGGTYVFAYSVIFLAVYAFVQSLVQREWRPLVSYIAVILLAAALAAPKLLPVLDLLGSHPRVVAAGSSVSWDDFLAFFIERDSKLGSNTWEHGAYVGIVVAVLYCFSLITIRNYLPLVISSLFMMLLAFGNFSRFAPWTILHELPLMRNFQLPSRSLIVFCFSVALLVGLYLNRWLQKDNKWIKLVVTGIVVIIGIDLFWYASDILPQATIPAQVSVFRLHGPTKLEKPAQLYYVPPETSTAAWRSIASVHQPFQQVSIPDLERFRHGAWSDQYLPLLQNKGVSDAYETFPFERYALAATDQMYRGEYYLLKGKTCQLVKWTPSRLVFRVSLPSGDRLVINQNYWPGWSTSYGKIINHNGLLAIDLPSGEHEVTVSYLPRSFLLGTAIFCLALGAILIAAFKTDRKNI